MPDPLAIISTDPCNRTISAVAGLLTRQRLDFAFVGSVARSAWLGDRVENGPIDVLALMNPEQRNQVCMMATHRGFVVDREEVQSADELDLIPMHFADPDGDIRVHILLASNALYGRMVAEAAHASFGDATLKVPSAEDFALLLTLSGDHSGRSALGRMQEFNREQFNSKLVSIGLGDQVMAS